MVIVLCNSHANGAVPSTGKTVHRLLCFLQVGAKELRQAENHLRRAFAHPKDFAGRILDGGLRPFVHGIEGNILFLLIALKDGRVFEAGHYREIDRIVVRCAGS